MAKPDDYKLYVHWYKTMDWILDKTEKMPVSARFSVANRIATLTIEIVELIVDAIYQTEKRQPLHSINRNIEKLRILFRLCNDRRYIAEKQYIYIAEQLNEAGRMCGGWLKSCSV